MDTMEWRALQQTMPAQLKQVAEAMGYTTEQLGAGLRKSKKDVNYLNDISMDDFISEIMRLDKEGVNGFASFSDQARAATIRIGTAMANLRTRIVKGVSTLIDAVGQENISGAINTVSSGIGSIAKNLAEDLKVATAFIKEHESELSSLVKTLTDIAPMAIRAYGAFKVFQGGKALFLGLTEGIMGTVAGFERLTTAGSKLFYIGDSMAVAGTRGAGAIKGLGSAAMEAGLLISSMSAGAVALTGGLAIGIAALYAYNLSLWNASYAAAGLTEEEKALVNSIHTMADQYESAKEQRDQAVKGINTEFDHVRDLKNEYNGLIDANGEVIAGNEERADEIIGELATALGIEKEQVYELTDSYGKLSDAAEDAISKRRAERLLEADKSAYETAVGNIDEQAQAMVDAQKMMDDTTARAAAAQETFQDAYQTNIDMLSNTPEAIGAASTQYGNLAYAADGSAAAVGDAAAAYDEAAKSYAKSSDEIANHEGLEAAISEGDVAKIEEYSARMTYSIADSANNSRETLERQAQDFRSRYEEMAAAVEAGDKSLEDDLESLRLALEISEAELAEYDAVELNDKFARIALNDGTLRDAQKNVYTWNGSQLLDKNGKAVVDEVDLVDAQGRVHTWNGTSLESKSASVSVNTQSMDDAKNKWTNLNFVTRWVDVIANIKKGDAAGGFFDLHASGGFVTNGPTVLGRDRNGTVHIAGEAGREWVRKHADGTTSIIPIENKKYIAPYADMIASMIGADSKSPSITVNLYYTADSDAASMARDIAFEIRRYELAGAF